MKILFITFGRNSYTTKNVCIFALDQAKALKSLGVDVRILSIDITSIRRLRSYKYSEYMLNDIPVYTVNFPIGKAPFFIQDYFSKLCGFHAFKKIIKSWTPNIIHTHFQGYVGACIKEKYNIPLIITEHSSAINTPKLNNFLLKMTKWTYSKSNKVISVSNALKNNIMKTIQVKSIVIPNIVDVDVFKEGESNKSKDCYRFVCTCNLIKLKRVDLLLTAFSKIKYQNISLTIFGDGEEKKNLQDLAKKLNIETKVFFKGHCNRNEISEVYHQSNCFILLSETETFGVAYIEAMAAGLPIIATKCGGPEDFINKDVGLLIEKNNITQAVNAMESVITNDKAYNSEFISKYVISKFSPTVVGQELLKVYKEIN